MGTHTFSKISMTAGPGDMLHDAAGFADAMANALVGGDFGTYGYSCAGAIGFGSTGSWTNAFSNVSCVYTYLAVVNNLTKCLSSMFNWPQHIIVITCVITE